MKVESMHSAILLMRNMNIRQNTFNARRQLEEECLGQLAWDDMTRDQSPADDMNDVCTRGM